MTRESFSSSGGPSGSRQSGPIQGIRLPEHEPLELDFQLPGDEPIDLSLEPYPTSSQLRPESSEMMHVSDPELRDYKMNAMDSDGSSRILVQLNNSRSNLPDPEEFCQRHPSSAASASTHPTSTSASTSTLTGSTRSGSSSRPTGISNEVIQPSTPNRSTNSSRQSRRQQQQLEDEESLPIATATPTASVQPSRQSRSQQSRSQPSQSSYHTQGRDPESAATTVTNNVDGDEGNGPMDPSDFSNEKSFMTQNSTDKTVSFTVALEKSPTLRWFLIGLVALILVAAIAIAGIVCGTGGCSSSDDPPKNETASESPFVTTAPVTVSPDTTGLVDTNTTPPVETGTPTTLTPTTESPTVVLTTLVPTTSPTEAVTTTAPTDTPTTLAPTVSPTQPETTSSAPTTFVPNVPLSTLENMQNVSTPQGKAFVWVQNYPGYVDLPEWRKRQLFAMATFYRAFNGHQWPVTRSLNWLDYDVDECEWASTQAQPCNLDGELTFLGLQNDATLEGTMPPEVAFLTQLQNLQIWDNGLPGTFDTVMPEPLTSELSNLRLLWIENNALTGTIPPHIAGLTTLTDLQLQDNPWSGNLPSEIGLMTNLRNIDLSNTQITGTIPVEWGALTALESLEISDTGLTGAIPMELCDIPTLTTIVADCTQIACCPTK